MRSPRFRHAARTTALGTAALVAALSLTACQGGDSSAADSAAPAANAPAARPAASDGSGSDKGAAASGADSSQDSGSLGEGTSGSGSTEAKPASDRHAGKHADTPASTRQAGGKDKDPVTRACDGGNTELTLKPVTRPLNHMLLTVTNTGSTACNAYYHPFLRFGEAQSAPQVFEESKPQAVVTLNPGQSAYAGVMTSSADGSGTGGYSTRKLSVNFQGRTGGGSSGPSANVPLGKAVYVDSTLTVTYWQSDMGDALMY
ncbi:DUF4232 domain-containing protein [Streptomyces sp. NBC_00178]|uniref:DUF4232 domain-containing protein n=1 Tax=Streptomyces sp. NBC_00178 TaxID=2975672 RepID=UPI002E28C602|nr:DUF4232 domain-containing protein [Streptomyces sp. NBC_00178]